MFLVSSDLSHFHTLEEAKKVDTVSIGTILDRNVDTVASKSFEACGNSAIAVLLALARMRNWNVKHVAYDTGGDSSRVVGYGSFIFYS